MGIQCMRSVAVVCLIFVVTACGAPQIKESTLPVASRVGVVSLLGSEFQFRKRGLTVFHNKLEQFDVTDWRVDEFVATSLHDDLKHRFEMVAVDHHQYDFSDGFIKGILEKEFDPERVERQIKAISDEYRLDALIIVSTYTAETAFAGYLDGYGILYLKRFSDPVMGSYAVPKLYFVDCHSLRVVARWGTISVKDIEGLPIHPTYTKYSADQKLTLKSWVEIALEKSLNKIVVSMKLTSLR